MRMIIGDPSVPTAKLGSKIFVKWMLKERKKRNVKIKNLFSGYYYYLGISNQAPEGMIGTQPRGNLAPILSSAPLKVFQRAMAAGAAADALMNREPKILDPSRGLLY